MKTKDQKCECGCDKKCKKSHKHEKKQVEKSPKPVFSMQEEMSKLESAYNNALQGQIKFKEVKSVFKKLHKQIKKQKNNS